MTEQEEDIPFPWEGRILSVTNLPYNYRPMDLRDFFARRGKILRVDVERSSAGKTNGLGFIEFATESDCTSAAALTGSNINGRTMKCRVATNPPPELVRFYVRQLNDRPVSDRVRARILDEMREERGEKPYNYNRRDTGRSQSPERRDRRHRDSESDDE